MYHNPVSSEDGVQPTALDMGVVERHKANALCCESGNRRCRRVPGTSDGEAAAGHARMGYRRRSPGLRQVRGPTLCGRPYLANTTGKCGVLLESSHRPTTA